MHFFVWAANWGFCIKKTNGAVAFCAILTPFVFLGACFNNINIRRSFFVG
jgi:hypothetical protein